MSIAICKRPVKTSAVRRPANFIGFCWKYRGGIDQQLSPAVRKSDHERLVERKRVESFVRSGECQYSSIIELY